MFDVPKEYATIFTPGADLLSFPVHLQKESLEESNGASQKSWSQIVPLISLELHTYCIWELVLDFTSGKSGLVTTDISTVATQDPKKLPQTP